MKSSARSKPGGGGGGVSRSGEVGGQLLQELEALSQALAQNFPVQKDASAPAHEKPKLPFPARDRRASEVIPKWMMPTSAFNPPLRHSVSGPGSGFRSSGSPVADEGQGKARGERRARGWQGQLNKEVGSFPEWLEDNMRFSEKLEAPVERKSIWNWKPFRALAHIGQQRFKCGFWAHVHGIEGLPARMNGMRLTVHFKHKDSSVQTLPARVFRGAVEFEETLHHKCAIFGSRKPSQGIKYMSKSFTLTVVALDMDELELGKHRLDLSRLLPESIDEKSDEENSNSWTTSFSLSGKGKGGSLLVTFVYEILASEKESLQVGNTSARFGDSPARRALRSFNSLPNSPHGMLRSRPSGVPLSSPAFSEPTSELADFLGMDHLNLEETFNQDETFHKGKIDSKQGTLPVAAQPKWDDIPNSVSHEEFSVPNGSLIAPRTPGQSVESSDLIRTSSSQQPPDLDDGIADHDAEFVVKDDEIAKDDAELVVEDDGIAEDDAEFVVQDQGVETSPFPGDLQTPTLGQYDGADKVKAESEPISAGTKEAFLGGDWHLQEDVGGLTAASKFSLQELNFRESEPIQLEESDSTVEQYVPDDLENILDQDIVPEEGRDDDDNNLINHGSWVPGLPNNAKGYDGVESTNLLKSSNDDHLATFVERSITSKRQGLELPPASKQLHVEVKSKVVESDDDAELVTGEFLNMLQGVQGLIVPSSDSESDSPRALLLQQFEQEALLEGGLGLHPNLPKSKDLNEAKNPPRVEVTEVEEKGWQQNYAPSLSNEGNELAEIMDAAESELQKATQTMRSKARAKMLEDAEAESLMQKWGLDERAFESSPPKGTDYYAYGNASGKLLEAPPLAYGFGSVVPTSDGGELRSMSSAHFQSAYNGGQLVMHVSKPVVVPADMGASALDILRRMAASASGVENIAMQAMLSMPLEDITGKSVHQIAFEGQTALELSGHRYAPIGMEQDVNRLGIDYTSQSMTGGFLSDMHTGSLSNYRPPTGGRTMGSRRKVGDINSEEVVSLEDLAPVAMEKIEALALEGLKIQSDMAEEEAPYTLDAMAANSMGNAKSRFDGFNLLEGVAATELLEGSNLPQEEAEGGDGFMSMAISLEEWMRLDAGVYDEAGTNENTLTILAAHNANHKSPVEGTSEKGLVQNKSAKASAGSGGFMGDTLTLAMLVQLRDPLRNYEPVGAPMMALVQAERVVIPPRPKLWRRVSMKGNNEDDEDEKKPEQQPQFKITGIHISGLKSGEDNKDDKKKLWGNEKQQQSGSRWLLANGMGKTAKPALLKSKPASTTTKPTQSESLWSISSRIQDTGKKWQQSSGRSSLVRNPDVTFTKKGVRKW